MKIKEALLNWKNLNLFLRECKNEDLCGTALHQEKTGAKRLQFLLRLYGRYNTLRTQREREELRRLK